MGPWNTVERYLHWTLDFAGKNNNKIYSAGRNPSASTATGYLKKHLAQQKEIITNALTI